MTMFFRLSHSMMAWGALLLKAQLELINAVAIHSEYFLIELTSIAHTQLYLIYFFYNNLPSGPVVCKCSILSSTFYK